MGRPRKKRRQSHGSAWHWKQTDCWYYTLPGTKRRVPLFDDQGQRIRGSENQQAAERALAQVRVAAADARPGGWPLAESGLSPVSVRNTSNTASAESRRGRSARGTGRLLFRGSTTCAVTAGHCRSRKLKKGHIQEWIGKHAGWRSLATHRSVIAIVLAAFNLAEEMFDVPSPFKGLKKPPATPRLHSFSAEDEQAIYGATEECFHDFLFAAIHTGLRPFCELAKITADHVEETERGMMWRVYSSKTKKTRKIPVSKAIAALTRAHDGQRSEGVRKAVVS